MNMNMKNLLNKMTQLEASVTKAAPQTAPKKKLLKESASAGIRHETSLTNLFNQLHEAMAPGQKPMPVVGKQGDTQKTGTGFLNITDPSPTGQAMQKALGDLAAQGKAQIVMPAASGQPQQNPLQPMQASNQPNQPVKEEEFGDQSGNNRFIKSLEQDIIYFRRTGNHDAANHRSSLIDKIKSGKMDSNDAYRSIEQFVAGQKNTQNSVRNRLTIPGNPMKEAVAKVDLDEANTGDEAEEKFNKYNAKELDHMLDRAFGKDKPGDALKQKRARQAKDAAYNIMFRKKYKGDLDEGAKVDRMVKHIEKSEKKSGKSKEEAQDIAWATANKRGMLDNKNKKKVKEGDIAPTNGIDTMGAGLGRGRSKTTLEGKKPDFLDLDKDGDKKEPMKKAAADKKKKAVKENMSHRMQAARLEGKAHGLKGHAHNGKHYDDMEESRAYHEGYKEGLDECYGMAPIVGLKREARMPVSTRAMAQNSLENTPLDEMEDHEIDDYSPHSPRVNFGNMTPAQIRAWERGASPEDQAEHERYRADLDEENDLPKSRKIKPRDLLNRHDPYEFERRLAFGARPDAAFAFEALDRQLNRLLSEDETPAKKSVKEGLSVSISKGHQNAPDSVTITAQDTEADQLLALVKQAGLGIFGGDAPRSEYGSPEISGSSEMKAHGGIEVVDDHDGMMGLMQKLSGIQSDDADYADEEDSEETCNEETCNECGGMMEAEHSCGGKQVVDEEESEEQMEFKVAEANAPDSGATDSVADEQAEAAEDAALATAGSKGGTYTVNEEDDEEEEDDNVNESFVNLYKKLAMLSEEADQLQAHKFYESGGGAFKRASEAWREWKRSVNKDQDTPPDQRDPNFLRSPEYLNARDSWVQARDEAAAEMGISGNAVEEKCIENNKDLWHRDKRGAPPFVLESESGALARAKKLHDQYRNYVNDMLGSDDTQYLDDEGIPDARAYMFAKRRDPEYKRLLDRYEQAAEQAAAEMGTSFAEIERICMTDYLKSLGTEEGNYSASQAQNFYESEKITEWANDAGKNGTETTFEQDIDFMTNIISGGLNKRKSTGQTTVPVVASQNDRIGYSTVNESINDLKNLAGLNEGKNFLREDANSVSTILANIVNALGLKDQVLPVLAARLQGQSSTVNEQQLDERRGKVDMIVGAILGLAIAIGGNAALKIVQALGGSGYVQPHERVYVPTGSSVTGERYDYYKSDEMRESTTSLLKRMKAITEGAGNAALAVIQLLVDLVAMIGAEEKFINAAQSANEEVLAEGDRRSIVKALLALIFAFGLSVAAGVFERLSGGSGEFDIPVFGPNGELLGKRSGTIHDPGDY